MEFFLKWVGVDLISVEEVVVVGMVFKVVFLCVILSDKNVMVVVVWMCEVNEGMCMMVIMIFRR